MFFQYFCIISLFFHAFSVCAVVDTWNRCWDGQATTVVNVRIGIAVDAGYRSKFSTIGQLESHVGLIINGANSIFLNQFGLRLVLHQLRVFENLTEATTWNRSPNATDEAQQCLSTPSKTLEAFRSWRSRENGSNTSLWHLLTACHSTSTGVQGLSHANSLCNPDYGVGMSVYSSFVWRTLTHQVGISMGFKPSDAMLTSTSPTHGFSLQDVDIGCSIISRAIESNCLIPYANPGPTLYLWRTTDWSSCSAACNGGASFRMVYCSTQYGQTVDRTSCNAGLAANTFTQCNTHRCSEISRWGKIDEIPVIDAPRVYNVSSTACVHPSCDNFSQLLEHDLLDFSNHAVCLDNMSIPVRSARCSSNLTTAVSIMRSTALEHKQTSVCSGEWITSSDWSACSHSCGMNGTQTRVVQCSVNGTSTLDMYCAARLRPASIRSCNVRECDSEMCSCTVWQEWSNCPTYDVVLSRFSTRRRTCVESIIGACRSAGRLSYEMRGCSVDDNETNSRIVIDIQRSDIHPNLTVFSQYVNRDLLRYSCNSALTIKVETVQVLNDGRLAVYLVFVDMEGKKTQSNVSIDQVFQQLSALSVGGGTLVIEPLIVVGHPSNSSYSTQHPRRTITLSDVIRDASRVLLLMIAVGILVIFCGFFALFGLRIRHGFGGGGRSSRARSLSNSDPAKSLLTTKEAKQARAEPGETHCKPQHSVKA